MRFAFLVVVTVTSPVDNSTRLYYHPEGMKYFVYFKYQGYITSNRVRNVGDK